jgi:predicted nucleic acid-binding protein
VTEARILIDTGPIVSLMSPQDARHEACAGVFRQLPPPCLTSWPVLTEAAWLFRRNPHALTKLFEAFQAGLFRLLDIGPDGLLRIAELMRRHETAGLQLANASLAHLAEREDIRTIFTLDHRDFSLLRLRNGQGLNLLPELR